MPSPFQSTDEMLPVPATCLIRHDKYPKFYAA